MLEFNCVECESSGNVPLFMGIETLEQKSFSGRRLQETCIVCRGTGKVAERRKENSDPRTTVSKPRKMDGLCTVIDPNGYIRAQQRVEERRI